MGAILDICKSRVCNCRKYCCRSYGKGNGHCGSHGNSCHIYCSR